MNRKILIVLSIAAFCMVSSSFADLVLSQDGRSDYTVVVGDNISDADRFLLADFTNLLSRALGRSVVVADFSNRPKDKRIFLGMLPEGIASLGNQEHLVMTKGSDLYISGGGVNGTRYAAYDFLVNDLGYRFFDARGGMRVPDARNFKMPQTNRRRCHDFEDRAISCVCRYTGPESVLFLYRHGMNAQSLEGVAKRYRIGPIRSDFCTPWPSDASLMEYLPRNAEISNIDWIKKTCGDMEKVHPEYFTLDDKGRRVFGHQRCLSNPDCRKLLKERYFRRLEELKRPSYVDLSAGDTPGRFCNCPGCLALESKYGSNAGPLIDVFLEFAPEVARLYPRHCLMTLAYRKEQTQHPPRNVERMPDNFVARFAPIDDDFSKDWTHPSNVETLDDLKRWCQMCRKVLMWYYPNPYGGDITPPLGNIERLANDIRIMKEAGTTGVTFEHNVGVATMTGFTELQSYVMLRLFDDVTLDWRELVDEFLDYEYGAASDGVKKYLAKLEDLRKTTELGFPWDASLVYYKYLTPERVDRWEQAFDIMERQVAEDKARLRNLRRLRLNLDYAAIPICKRPELAKRIREIHKEIAEDCFADSHAGDAKKCLSALEESLALLEIQNGKNAKPLPTDVFGGIAADRVFVTLPRSYSGGRHEDPDAAFGFGIVFDGIKRPEAMKLPFVSHLETVLPKPTYSDVLGHGVDRDNLGPRGQYKFYEMGSATVTKDCFIELNTWWFQAKIGGAYKEGSFNKVKIYASLKFEGPVFYPADAGKPNLVWCDRVVVVRD